MKQSGLELPSCSFFACMNDTSVPDFECKNFKSPKKSLRKNTIHGVTSPTAYKSSPDLFIYSSLPRPSQKHFPPPETQHTFQRKSNPRKEQKITKIQNYPTAQVLSFKKKPKNIGSLLAGQGHPQKTQSGKLRDMGNPIRFSYQEKDPRLKKMVSGRQESNQILHTQSTNQIPRKQPPKTPLQISNQFLDFQKSDALISTQIILQPNHKRDPQKKFLDPYTQQKFFKKPTIESKFLTQQEIGNRRATKNEELMPRNLQSNRSGLAISFFGEQSENSVVYETHREFGKIKLQTLF